MSSGTFVPTIKGSETPGTAYYATQIGRWSRVDNMVTVYALISSALVSPSGILLIEELPFAVANIPNYGPKGVCVQFSANKFWPIDTKYVLAYGQAGTKQVQIMSIRSAQPPLPFPAHYGSGTVEFTLTYETDEE